MGNGQTKKPSSWSRIKNCDLENFDIEGFLNRNKIDYRKDIIELWLHRLGRIFQNHQQRSH
jgi:hypothetical protein